MIPGIQVYAQCAVIRPNLFMPVIDMSVKYLNHIVYLNFAVRVKASQRNECGFGNYALSSHMHILAVLQRRERPAQKCHISTSTLRPHPSHSGLLSL